MATQHQVDRPDALDEWVGEVGESYVGDIVEATRLGVIAGTIPSFDDRDAFLQHLHRTSLHKPALHKPA